MNLKNAPIYYALAQVKFNPVLKMSKYVDDIQDEFRVKGFPVFEAANTMGLRFSASAESQPNVEANQVPEWIFSDEDSERGFILMKDSLTFHTTHYQSKEKLIENLMLGLNAITGTLQLNRVKRLGLRFLDAVVPLEGESTDDYLVDGIRGLNLDFPLIQSISESVFQTDKGPTGISGILVTKVYHRNGEIGYPPDLHIRNLKSNRKFKELGQNMHAVLDTDHYVEGDFHLDFDSIEKQILHLHSGLKLSFEKMVTSHALNIWNK